MGVRGLEPRTSALSEPHSNQLSYTPPSAGHFAKPSGSRQPGVASKLGSLVRVMLGDEVRLLIVGSCRMGVEVERQIRGGMAAVSWSECTSQSNW